MKSVIIQFHALPEELVEFVNQVEKEFKLTVILLRIKPFSIENVTSKFNVEYLKKYDCQDEINIILSVKDVHVDVQSQKQLLSLNKGCIVLALGRLSENQLNESRLSFISDSKEEANLVTKIVSRLKKKTIAGAIAVNPITLSEAKIRTHRFTEGARKAYLNGTKINPLAGNCFYKLD